MAQGAAAEVQKIEDSRPSWRSEVWAGCRQATIAIAVDVVIYCSCLIGLMICYLALQLFRLMGYPADRLALFELLHFWAYWGLSLLFVWDLVIKSAILLFKGWKSARNDA